MTVPIKMIESGQLGLPGLSMLLGTHLCGFFQGQEKRADIVFPFLQEDLRCGDKCLCAFDAADRDVLHGSPVLENLYYVPPEQWAGSCR
jgi:hypothetical protein